MGADDQVEVEKSGEPWCEETVEDCEVMEEIELTLLELWKVEVACVGDCIVLGYCGRRL